MQHQQERKGQQNFDSGSIRLAIFTHDAYGLGHVRRCLHIIQSVAQRAPNAAILLITGSPAVDLFSSLPPNADYLKIPTIVTSGTQSAKPPMLPIGVADISFLRRQLIREALITFSPDVLLVDNFPLGAKLELLPSLLELRKNRARIVLGLRDIADPPKKIQVDWGRDGVYEILDHYYDSILVYGMREVLDIETAYALSPAIAAKVRYCGYVTSEVFELRPPGEIREELGLNRPFVLATVGGGGDGFPLIQTVLKSLAMLPSTSALVVTGAFMNPEERKQVESLAALSSGVVVRGFINDFPSYVAAADVVVSMGGYNTTAEILALRPRSIVVPRHWRSGEHTNRTKSAGGDMEQVFRCEALANLGYMDLIHPEELSAKKLADRIVAALESEQVQPKMTINVSGAQLVAEHLLALAQNQESIS